MEPPRGICRPPCGFSTACALVRTRARESDMPGMGFHTILLLSASLGTAAAQPPEKVPRVGYL